MGIGSAVMDLASVAELVEARMSETIVACIAEEPAWEDERLEEVAMVVASSPSQLMRLG